MTESNDPKVAFVLLAKEHLAYQPIQFLSRYLIADQSAGFWKAPFSGGRGRWDCEGGLAEAMLVGYRALRMLEQTVDKVYTKVDVDRVVALYLSLITARWVDLRSMVPTFDNRNHASFTSTAVANAVAIGMEIRPVEVQAIIGWHLSRLEMAGNHEGFTPEWWVISETMSFLFVANRT